MPYPTCICPPDDKPMDIFGPHWENHFERIRDSWLSQVTEEDVVLLPGDFTWAMRLDEAMEDIGKRGRFARAARFILRGNHDYWWGGIGQRAQGPARGHVRPAERRHGNGRNRLRRIPGLDAARQRGRHRGRFEDLSAGTAAAGNVSEGRPAAGGRKSP